MLDFTGDLAVEQRRIEGFNAGNAAAGFQQRLPRLCRGIANGGNKTDARNYDSAGNKRILLSGSACRATEPACRTKCAATKRLRPRALRNSNTAATGWMPRRDAGMPPGPLLFLVFDVGDGIADGTDLFGVFVGDFQFEGFFEGHDEFHNVQGVGAKVIDERCLVVNLALVHTQLLYDDLLDLLFYC
jgi:hypothetical protein